MSGPEERHPDWPRPGHAGELNEWAIEQDREAEAEGRDSNLADIFDGDAMNS